jgi:phosphotransacetylase
VIAASHPGDLVQNAIDLAVAVGVQRPKVAILSALETVNPRLRSSLEAAVLAKMAERGQIHGAIVDGPLQFDNAVSVSAARSKGIASRVAGQPGRHRRRPRSRERGHARAAARLPG